MCFFVRTWSWSWRSATSAKKRTFYRLSTKASQPLSASFRTQSSPQERQGVVVVGDVIGGGVTVVAVVAVGGILDSDAVGVVVIVGDAIGGGVTGVAVGGVFYSDAVGVGGVVIVAVIADGVAAVFRCRWCWCGCWSACILSQRKPRFASLQKGRVSLRRRQKVLLWSFIRGKRKTSVVLTEI